MAQMILKAAKILIKLFLTFLIIPYMFSAGILFIIAAFLPEIITVKIAKFYAQLGWTICSLNLRLSSDIKIEADEFRGSYILISNHIGSLDFMIMHELAIKNSMLKNMKYIIKKEAIYIPIFGYVMKKINFLFVKRNFEEDKLSLEKCCKEIKEKKQPVWFVVYPEGTRFTEEKKEKSKEYSLSRGLPLFDHVLYPRGKGLNVIINNLSGSHVKSLVDVTFHYFGKVPSLLYFLLFVTDAKIRVNARKIEIKEIEDVSSFLIDSFKRKDCLIEKWKKE